jgi:Flp pilus assembly protein TadD
MNTSPPGPYPATKIIGSVVLLLIVIAISVGGCYVLLPIYAKPVSNYLAAKADEAYAAARYRQSIVDLGEACRLDPQNSLFLNNLAWLLATCPDADARDGKRAVEIALRACQLTSYQNAADLDTLAAAYAETGDFDNAVKWETTYLSSLSLTPSDASDGQARLALYQAHKPYHSEQ